MSRRAEWPGDTRYKWPTHRTRRVLVIELMTVLLLVLAAISITRAASAGGGSPESPTVPATVTAKVERGVVDVVSTLGLQSAEAAGTGMVVTATGEVITNNHVVNGATSVQVTDVGNGRSYSAVVVGTDAANDVAVLQLDGASGLATVMFGNSTNVSVGDTVVAMGNAGGVGGKPSTAGGTVTALGQSITATDPDGLSEQLSNMVQTDAGYPARRLRRPPDQRRRAGDRHGHRRIQWLHDADCRSGGLRHPHRQGKGHCGRHRGGQSFYYHPYRPICDPRCLGAGRIYRDGSGNSRCL